MNISSFFIQPAFAAEATAAPESAGMVQILLLVAMVAVFYFLLWRPQNKRAKAHKQLIADIKVGDEVATASGIMGIISALNEENISLQIAQNTTIQMQKSAIVVVYPNKTIKLSA